MKHKSSSGVYVDRSLLRSEAWFKLSATSMRCYLIFLCKRSMLQCSRKQNSRKEWTIQNNGQIEFTYDEAESYHISRQSFSLALDQLVEYGFISIAKLGGGLHKATSCYSLIEDWRQYGTEAFTKPKPRPKAHQGKQGFKRENTLGKNCKNIKSSVVRNTGAGVVCNTGGKMTSVVRNTG